MKARPGWLREGNHGERLDPDERSMILVDANTGAAFRTRYAGRAEPAPA